MRKKEQNIADKRENQDKDEVGLKQLPTSKGLSKINQNTPKAEIPKRKCSLLSKPLVLLKRILQVIFQEQRQKIAKQTSDVERYRSSIPSTAPAEPLRIQLTTEATRAFLSFDTQRSLTEGVIAFQKELSPLETSVIEAALAAQINLGLSRFLWNFQILLWMVL